MEGVQDNASAFMHLDIKTNKSWFNKINFLNQAESVMSESLSRKFLNFMVMQIGKPENEGTLFRV